MKAKAEAAECDREGEQAPLAVDAFDPALEGLVGREVTSVRDDVVVAQAIADSMLQSSEYHQRVELSA